MITPYSNQGHRKLANKKTVCILKPSIQISGGYLLIMAINPEVYIVSEIPVFYNPRTRE